MKKKLFFVGALVAISQTTNATIDMYSVNVPADARPQAPKTLMAQEQKEKKEKGYIEEISLKYNYLSNIEKRVGFASEKKLKSLDLFKNSSEVISSLPLKTVPSNAKSATIGYSGGGTFNKDTGWTGITEIFKSSIGICQFSHFDLKASNGGYSLSEKDSLDVNSKHAYAEVEGKINHGFSYEVTWFDELNMYTLSCVNKDFSKEFTQKVIDLAKRIDKG